MLMSVDENDLDSFGPFDIIVVGAGAVGLTMSIDLARKGHRVILLEAGPSKPAQSSQKFFEMARATGHNFPGLHVGRFRCLGGTTHFWGGQLVPFAPIVFDNREWLGEGWPISASDVEVFYKEVFDILGMENVLLDDDQIWRNLGVAPPPETEYIHPIFTRWTPESNLVIHFSKDIQENSNLIIVYMAQVGALRLNDDNQVTGVELRFENGGRKYISAKKTILANGTVEISRLLQLPASGGAITPWAENPWVGHGFFDHVDTYAASVHPIDRKLFMNTFENAVLNGLKYSPKLRLADEIQYKEKLLEISAHFVFNSSVSENITNLKIVIKGLLRGRLDKSRVRNPIALLSAFRFVVPMAIRYLRYRRIMNLTDGGIQLRLTSEQIALKESRIILRSERDAFDMPLVDVDWKIGPEVLETMGRFAEYLKDYLKNNGLADIKIDPQLLARDPGYLDKTDDANHQMGGARMASSAEVGVVDENCKVFGAENLYVAGAAVFPTSGFANPTFTAIALGMRLANHLDGILKGDRHATSSSL
jgi:hypothetical protein